MFSSPWIRKPDFTNIRDIDYDDYWKHRGWELNGKLKPREAIMLDIIPPGSRVADVGCGNSLLPVKLMEKNCRVSVADISSVVLDQYNKLGIKGFAIDLEKVNKIKLSEKFDFIILSEVLEHVRNPEEVVRALKPYTNNFLITVPNSAAYQFRYGLMFRGRFFTQWVYHPSEHVRYWSHIDFLDWLRAMGLEVVATPVADGFSFRGRLPWLPRLWKNLLGYRMIYHCRVGASQSLVTSMQSRLANEVEHGKKLEAKGAEKVWNWSSPAGQKRANRRAEYIIKVGRITSRDKVLEIGCGTGLFTKKIQESTRARITAIDLSEELLTIARKEVSNVDFRLADAMSLDFEDGEFDVVCGSSILHHLDMVQALGEAYRALKPGGRLVFAEPNMLNPQIFIQKNIPLIKKWLGDSPDETAIVRWRLADDMKRLGFVDVRIFPYDFLHPSTPESLIPTVDFVGRAFERVLGLREIAGSVIIYGRKP